MDTWEEWSARIISFSKAESATRPFIKNILKELEKANECAYPEGIKLLNS